MGTPLLVLGADVGGTNTKIALADFQSGRPSIIRRDLYPSRDYATLESIVEQFVREAAADAHVPAIAGACFAVAGPVERGRARLTNLTWQLDEANLAARFGFATRIINDFAAAGLGIEHLAASDLTTLQAGSPIERAQRVVVGAGTGLGVALLDCDEGGYEVLASEGGHADFAPIDDVQDELLSHLRQQFGHVSWERVVSGGGLPRILAFLAATGRDQPTQALRDAMETRDPAEAITEFALRRLDEAAARALDIFTAAYGAFAGNMALVTLAHGGLYVAGGIAPKISAKLEDGTFIRAFAAKGRFRKLLETIPVHIVMNEHLGLYGALAEAARIARAV